LPKIIVTDDETVNQGEFMEYLMHCHVIVTHLLQVEDEATRHIGGSIDGFRSQRQ